MRCARRFWLDVVMAWSQGRMIYHANKIEKWEARLADASVKRHYGAR